MKKHTYLFIVLALVFNMKSFAQQHIELGAHGSFGFLMPDIEGLHNLNKSFGVGFFGEYFFNDNISAGIETDVLITPNYTRSWTNEFDPGSGTYITIDQDQSIFQTVISAFGNYYFLTNEFQPYGGVGVGYLLSTRSSSFSSSSGEVPSRLEDLSLSQNGLIISPKVGFKYFFKPTFGIHISAAYNIAMNGKTESVMVNQTSVDVDYEPTSFLQFNAGITLDLFRSKFGRF